MRCRYTNKPCPYVGIGAGCVGGGCPELDDLYDYDDENDVTDDEPDSKEED